MSELTKALERLLETHKGDPWVPTLPPKKWRPLVEACLAMDARTRARVKMERRRAKYRAVDGPRAFTYLEDEYHRTEHAYTAACDRARRKRADLLAALEEK